MLEKFTYKDSLNYLYGLQKFGIKFGLSTTSNLLAAFGNPHKGKKYIHVGGSNGKGSVSVMLESVLVKAGYRVGFYSSPHLVRFTERFRINGREIDQQEVVNLTKKIKGIIKPDHPPTVFEVTTAMALLYFADQETDINIMEVGMGGRLDATNIIDPLITVITNISLEHQEYLGSSLIEIAGEKAGIIKKGVALVTGAAQPAVRDRFESICREKKAPFLRLGKDFRYRTKGNRYNYYGMKSSFKDLELGLKGRFQSRNASLSMAVIELLKEKGIEISDQHISHGLKNATWPGRLQKVSEKPAIVLDGAHNPAAIREMMDSLGDTFQYNRLILLIGVMEDKDIRQIMGRVVPGADYVIYTSPDYYRSASPEELKKAASSIKKKGEVIPSIKAAIDRAKAIASTDDLVLITGSLFTVGEALPYFDPVKYRPDPV